MAKKKDAKRSDKIVRHAKKTFVSGKRPAKLPKSAAAKDKGSEKQSQAPSSILSVKGKIVQNKAGFSKKEVDEFKLILLKLRDKITGQISFLADDSLKYVDDTPSDDRTDDFDREFALNLASSEHDSLFEVDEALRRIANGTYGQCEECPKPIEKPRLKALPFARLCLKCQSLAEHGRVRFRPFGETLDQNNEPAAEADEPEESE